MPFLYQELTAKIIECVIKVHQILGPGFVEHIYKNALIIELTKIGLDVEAEKVIHVYYTDIVVGKQRLDLMVENKIVLELKNVEALHPKHFAQMKSYLRATNCDVGLLVNFASAKAEFRRIERT